MKGFIELTESKRDYDGVSHEVKHLLNIKQITYP
jgi:hypothetical protein